MIADLPFYVILRFISNKLLGVIAMFGVILAIMLLPVIDLGRSAFLGGEAALG